MKNTYTLLIPVINETNLLRKTFDVLSKLKTDVHIERYMIIICDRTEPESLAVIEELKQAHSRIDVVHQKLPFIGGAMQDGFNLTKTSHVVILSSDMETDPASLDDMIPLSQENPEAIITATRWTQKDTFSGYSPLKKVLNYIFQFIVRLVYQTKLTDATFGYRVFPTKLVQKIKFTEFKHPFFLETILIPIRLGTKVLEVPTTWVARDEGESQNTFFRNFVYFRVLFNYRFKQERQLVK